MDHHGAVTAVVGGADYASSQFNRATDAIRSAGSTFKLFVYLTAIEQGLSADSPVVDEPDSNGWPRNFSGRYEGRVALRRAFEGSFNAAAVRLARQVKPEQVVGTARRLGITTPIGPDPSIALGSGGVSLFELTRAYGAVATGGRAVDTHLVSEIDTASGWAIYTYARPSIRRLIAPDAAQAMGGLLRGVVTRGTGRAARDLDRWSAGKTGTSQSYRDAWFVGFTTDRISGVWLGNDDGSAMDGVTGGGAPAGAWRKFHATGDRNLTEHKG